MSSQRLDRLPWERGRPQAALGLGLIGKHRHAGPVVGEHLGT
jgi:hypothetical protein